MASEDLSKSFVFKTILLNNRLVAYENYIKLALDKGYNVCSMKEFYDNPADGKHFVLRHDVDYPDKSTRKMFKVEKKLGVHSTYYFRKSTMNLRLMQEMVAAGFEVGFHYETISDYAIEHSLESVSDADLERCKVLLKEDIMAFNQVLDSPIYSIVAHGAPKNVEIGISNNVLLKDRDYDYYGIEFEGYDEQLYANYVDIHMMDCNLRRYFGFSYEMNPISAIETEAKNIIFLAHPNHWYKDAIHHIWEIIAFCIGRGDYEISTTKFKRILDRKANI